MKKTPKPSKQSSGLMRGEVSKAPPLEGRDAAIAEYG